MNAEIESCLNTLRGCPWDSQALSSLQQLLVADASLSEEDLSELSRSVEHHRQCGHWETVIQLVDLQLPLIADPQRKAELLNLKGRILEDELLVEEQAIEAFQQALELQPENEALIEALEQIEMVRESWQRVAARYVEEGEAASDRELASSMYLYAAEVLWRNGGETKDIEGNLRRSLEVDPGNSKASAHLERLLRQLGRHQDLARVLEERCEVAQGTPERIAALLATGSLWDQELNNPDEAAAHYRRAVSLDPSDTRAMSCLADLLTRQENWTGLIRLYEEALRPKVSSEVDLGALLQIAILYYRKLGQLEQAEDCFRQIRKSDPTHQVMLDFYREYYREQGEPMKILAMLDAAIRMTPDPERRVQLAMEMAQVAEYEVGNLEKAIDIWKGIQRTKPDKLEAVAALKRLYRLTQPPKWNALRELLKEEIDGLGEEQQEEKIRLLLEVVEIYRDHLKLDVMVINTYKDILTLQPDHAEALGALTEKYESMGRYNDLIGLLQRRREVAADTAQQIQILHQMASLWIDKFGNHSQAIKPLEDILALDPLDERALGALREIHTRRRNWRELMELCRLEAAHRQGQPRRELYKEMAALAADKLGDAREGIQIWNQVLADCPDDSQALAELSALYRREERWPAVAEILHRQAEASGENAEETIGYLESLGDIYTNRLRVVDNAIEVWQAVLSLKSESPKARAVLRELYVQERRWDELQQLFLERGQFSELAETLTAAADRSSDRELKEQLYFRVGQICSEQLQSPERATKAYERVIAINPDNVAAASSLVELYQASEKWTRLLSTYEILLNKTSDTAEKLELLDKICRLCEEQLGSKTLAFQWCAQAYTLAPEDPRRGEELERLAAESDAWEELVKIYNARVESISTAEGKAQMLRELAQLCLERLHRPEEAERYFRQLLEIHEEDINTLEALEQIYTMTLRWAELADIYSKRADLEEGAAAKVEFLFKNAYIQEERLGDPLAAIEALNAIAEVQPENLRALKSLERLYQVRSEWQPLVGILARELDLAGDKETQVELLFRLGEINKTRIDQHGAAVEAFARVLSLDPVHRGTVQALESYLGEESELRVRVASLLQPFYERTEDWRRLVQVVQILLDAERDRPARLVLLRRLMVLQGKRLKNGAEAFAAGAAYLALEPEDGDIRREMSALADRLDLHEELARLLAEALEGISIQEKPELERALSWELALLLDDRLGRPEEAEPYLRRVVELNSNQREAFDILERILRDSSKWSDLRDLLQARKELAEAPATRRDILLQICALSEDVLDDTAGTIGSYEEVLAIEPDNVQALRALERHYSAAERWQDLVDLLRREMDFASADEELIEIKLRQATLIAEKLGDLQGAIDLLEEVVAIDPDRQPAVELLESLLTRGEHRRRIIEILESVYHRRNAWPDLVRVLLARRALPDVDRFEAVELLTRAATIFEERLGDETGAFTNYREALTLEPGASHIHQAVERLAATLEAWQEAADTWSAALQAADPMDLPLRSKLLERLARLYDEKLAKPEQARETYEELIELDSTNSEVAQPAAEVLVRLYEQDSLWPQLIEVLRRQVEWAADSAARQRLLLRISQIQEEVVGEVLAAIETYQELLQENPTSPEALDALERLFLQGERWAPLVEIYRRRVVLSKVPEERRGLMLCIARLYEDELDNLEEAIASYLMVLEEISDDLEAIRALKRIYREKERWSDLLEMIERELLLVPPEEQVPLMLEAAAVEHWQLADPALALGRYQAVLERDPKNDEVRQALEELLGDAQHQLAVAALLAPRYEEEENWAQVIHILELQIEAADTTAKIQLLQRIAELHEVGLDQPGDAFDATRRAIQIAAAEPELIALVEQLHRYAQILDRYNEYVQTLEGILADVLDVRVRIELHQRAAAISREVLDDPDRALEHYQRILDIEPENEGALQALDELFSRLERWDSLLEVLSRRGEIERDLQKRHIFLIRAAEICRDKLEQPEEAIAGFEQVLDLEGQDGEAMAALDDLYQRTERWPDLADLLDRRIAVAPELAEQVELSYRLGKLRADRLDDQLRALESFQQVLALDPAHRHVVADLEGYLEDPALRVEAARILEPIYVGRQDWSLLIRIYEIRLEAADDPNRRLGLVTRIAQLYEEQLEDLEQAFAWYGKVFLEKPADAGIREQLLRLAGILDRWQDLAAIFAQHLDQTYEENETTRTIALLLGGIYDDRLYKTSEAVACYQRVLSTDRGDDEAFRLLESLLTRAERWQDLLALYNEMAQNTLDPGERRELQLKIARVWEEALEDLPEAIDAYRTILEMDERDAEGIEALDRLYSETERWQDLAELLNLQVGMSESEELIVQLKFRMGNVFELKLEDISAAIDYYEEALQRDPGHEGSVSALERLILDRDQRFRIAQVLEPIYKLQDEWAKLVVIYDAQLEFIDDKDRRIFLLTEIARLHEERNGSLELAFKALSRALEEEITSEELLTAIEPLAEQLASWPELTAVLRQGVEGLYDFHEVARLQAKIAWIEEEKLGNKAAAVEAWRKVLSAEDGELQAITALERLLHELDRNEELIEILTRKAELTNDIDVRRATFFQMAEIYESRLVQPEMAAEVYRQVLAFDDSDLTALNALERLCLMAQNWMELVWVYRRKIEVVSSADEQRALQLAVAKVYEEKLADSFEAIAAYKVLLEGGADAEVLDALDRLYSKEALHSDLLEIIELKIEREEEPSLRNQLVYRAGSVLEQEIGDLEGAITRYRQVLEDDAFHREARSALERLVREDIVREIVSEILEQLYVRLDEVPPLVEVLELRLEGLADPLAKQELLQRVARLQENAMGDQRAAFATYVRALGEGPENELVQAELERLARELPAWTELVEAYEARFDSIYDAALGRALHLKVAGILEEHLAQDLRAAEHYRAALDLGGDELEPLGALDRIYLRQQLWNELLEVLSREVLAVAEPELQADLYCRLGKVKLEQNSDYDSAFAALRDALERNPELQPARAALESLLANESYRVPVLDVLEPIYEQREDYSKLIELFETRLTTLLDPFDRIALLERIAEIQEQVLGAPAQAVALLGRALAEDPSNEAVLDRLESLGSQLDNYQELVHLADQILAGELSAEAARATGLRAAAWYSEKLNDPASAERCLTKVLEVDPECAGALSGLEQLFRGQDRSAELDDILWRRAEVEQNMELKRGYLIEVASLREIKLEQPAGAISAWQAILEIDASDGEALHALANLHEASGAWEEYLEVLDAQLSVAQDLAEQVRLKLRAGEVLRDTLADEDRAIEAFRDALEIQPDEPQALATLEDLFARREDWSALQEVLLQRLQSEQGEGRVLLYQRLAELAEQQLGNIDEAAGYLHQILSEMPEHLETMDRLGRLLRRAERWYDLVELLRRQSEVLGQQGSTAAEVERLVEASSIWSEKLENPDAAANLLEEILRRDAYNVTALAGLARLYETTEQWDSCREVLERAAALGPGPKEAADLEFRMGRVLLQQSKDEGGAAAHFERALELNATHLEAAEAIERISRKQENWPRLTEMLELRAGTGEEKDRLPLLIELGQIYAGRLELPQRAVEAMERARAINPQDPEVLTPLADAYFAAERYEEAAPILEELIDVAGRRRSKATAKYTFRLGAIYERKGEIEAARKHYDQAYRMDSTHGPTLAALGRIYAQQEDWANARRIYRSMLLLNLDESAGITKADVFYNLGQAHLALGERSKALSMFERGLESDPTHTGLQVAVEQAKS